MTRKYLIIAPSWVGDMVMSQSLYRYLKMLHPNCIIDVAAPTHNCDLAKFMPEINKAIPLEFKHGELNFSARKGKAQTLISENYTHSIVLPNSWKSALLPYFAKIKTRIGWHGEQRFLLLNDRRRLDKTVYPLMIERFCALAIEKHTLLPKQLPYPSFVVKIEDVKAIQSQLKLSVTQPTIALCSGAEFGPAKKWPSHYYAELAQLLLARDYQVILLGGPKDKKTTQTIVKACHNHESLFDFAGETSLSEAIHLLSSCVKVVSNDSGLMHIACALNIPTLVIYGSTSDRFTPPLSNVAKSIYLDDLSCRPCFKRTCPLEHMNCLNQLKPQLIMDALALLPSNSITTNTCN